MRRSDVARWQMICLVSLGLFLGLGIAVYASGILPGDLLVRQFLLGSDGGMVRKLARWANYGGRVHVLLPAAILLFVLSSGARRHWGGWCGGFFGVLLFPHPGPVVGVRAGPHEGLHLCCIGAPHPPTH